MVEVDPNRCIKKVSTGAWSRSRQCLHRKTEGSEFCIQHNPIRKQQRDIERAKQHDLKMAEAKQEWNDCNVGARLRKRNPELYLQILEDLKK